MKFKTVFITMLVFYLIAFFAHFNIVDYIFPGAGTEGSFAKNISFALVLLSGLVVGCTWYIEYILKQHINMLKKDFINELSKKEIENQNLKIEIKELKKDLK